MRGEFPCQTGARIVCIFLVNRHRSLRLNDWPAVQLHRFIAAPQMKVFSCFWPEVPDFCRSLKIPDVLGWKYSGNRHHPTEKPVTSLQPLIESFTHPNAIVLDPFAGSGSTCVAALQSGRRYIGIELLEQYHRAGQQRLAAVQRAMQQGAANDDWFMPEAA